MKTSVIVAVVAAVIVAGGVLYAWQSGFLNFDYQTPAQDRSAESASEAAGQTASGQTAPAQIEEEAETEPEPAQTGTPIPGRSFTLEEAESQPRICEQDSDCKIIAITCNNCDCGRPVNAWIEPYQCTEADKANPCNFSCEPSRAVCNAGVCEKVAA